MSEAKEQKEQWHLDRKVPLTLVFLILCQAAMVVWAMADIKKDVEVLKAQSTSQRDRDAFQDKTTSEAMALLRQYLDRMDAKLDRLIEGKRK